MLLAYMRGQVNDHRGVYELVDDLGAMVSDYTGHFGDADQDYFMARSIFVGDAVLSNASGRSLKNMLKHFHENVSHSRICHYDVFRRQGYDANLMLKAFPDWTEGKDFGSCVI